MANTFTWVPPTNASVGSVLVYRATDTSADSLGSRSIIDTIGAKDGNGSWVVSYTDSNGTTDSLYRIRFWDGTGSSPMSDAIGAEYNELLATYDDVIRISRLNAHNDVGSAEVYDAIEDAGDMVFYEYGDPIKKTKFYLDNETGVAGQSYDFTGDHGPVYQVREVYVDSVDRVIVPSTSYMIDYGQGTMRFTDAFLGSYQGKMVYVHWVPAIMNVLIKNMAAKELLEGELIMAGTQVESPYVEKLKNKIMKAQEYLRPKGLYSTKSFPESDGYEDIPQLTDRKSLYFNY